MIEQIKHFFGTSRTFGVARSGQWPTFRNKFLEGKSCAVCGTLKRLECHHIKVYWKYPELECVESNIIVLCRPHHLEWGHLGSFKSWNDDIIKDADWFSNRIKNRP